MENKFLDKTTNRLKSYYYAVRTLFGTKKKVDEINQRNLEEIKKGEDLNILLHGASSNYYRSMYSTIKLFEKENIRIISIGYDYSAPVQKSAENVGRQIQNLMEQSNKEKFNLIGFCLGGLIARYYTEVLGGKKFVEKLVTAYSPLKPVPLEELGCRVNKLMGGRPDFYNKGLEKLIGRNSIQNHLFIYSPNDKIITLQYAIDKRFNQTDVRGGHLLLSYNPQLIKSIADFLKKD